MNGDTEKKNFSFGFVKTVSNKRLDKSLISENANENKDEKDFLISVDNSEIRSKKPKEEKKKEYIIPLISKNDWKGKEKQEKKTDGASSQEVGEVENDIDSQAIREILKDTENFKKGVQDDEQQKNNLAIPILMQNKIPEGYETDDRLNVELRPDEPTEADYSDVPIEHFGKAMLRGMGWKDGEGVGNKGKNFKPIEAVLRPKGLGLGADRSQMSALNDSKEARDGEQNKEHLLMKVGTHCIVLKGSHTDRYGEIVGIDEDNARVMIKLAINGSIVSLSQIHIHLVTPKEFTKNSKCINNSKYAMYKKDQENTRRESQEKSKRKEEKVKDLEKRSQECDWEPEEKVTKKRWEKRKTEDDDYYKSKKLKKKSNRSKERDESVVERKSWSSLWIQPKIRVRIIDKNYQKGNYYKEKVEVIDVISPENCVCRTTSNKVLEGISQTMLETVIPKSDGAHVLLISGKHKGQLGHILKKDKSNCSATVQLLKDRDILLKMDFDEICEFTGDIDEEFDY